MEQIKVKIMVKEGFLPIYGSSLSSGADLLADIPKAMTLAPGQRALIPTSLYAELPDGYEIQVRPRSGLAVKFGVTVLNSPGTVDCDYRGEIKVPLINLGQEPFVIQPKDRIAQMVLAPVVQADFQVESEISATERGAGGFGSTGISGK